MIEAAIKVTPLHRASTTDDIADAVTFLACDAGMMTGQALVVDGGRTMWSTAAALAREMNCSAVAVGR